MKCPNCHNEIPANSKFCTYCGFKIPQVAATGAQAQGTQPGPQPQYGQGQPNQFNNNQFNNGQPNFNQGMNQQQGFNQSNQTGQGGVNININMDQTSAYAKNYWAYLMHGVRHPSDIDTKFNKYFGLISLFAGSLIVALTFLMTEVHLASGALSELDSYAGSNTSATASFGTFFGVLLVCILFLFLVFSVTHLVTRGFLGDKSANYMEDMTRYFHISSVGLLVAFIGFVLSIIGSFAIILAAMCLMFYYSMVSMGYIALVFRAHTENHFDRVYAYFVGSIILVIGMAIVMGLLGGIIGVSALSSLSDLF
ncbi:zinc ribbon domain-containing protein [Lactobacillus sp. LC28-10]|uniref:Zinc ribbon domain-containing protein n=1 Tax=Secundilactobacillus angelensis TaxID=2722706 RepID=A0ABX1KYB2_9LACO|nr:zinc ribbon domain-containing protein [Secundilactobacillus angelensis]MCH5461780.1 zinc ribbon domain-containing protein [Secundilactobacillus angelensis]NLR18619.1 zinc ribbon domain-containing protein [Secundilactobacillus angelensis]